ncbi:MAG: sulfatase [Verrucomicrobia bacterium]|nr:sulfatase [Verrucomicrobiota bacterium]
MNRSNFLAITSALILGFIQPPVLGADQNSPPNVLFIVIDDLNDWIGCLEGHPDAKTPNIDQLAKQGVLFTNAHCTAPLCNPSRTSVFSGRMPSTTGVYSNEQWWRPALPGIVTIPEHFKNNGYQVLGGGKVFHHENGSHPPGLWHQFFDQVFDDPFHRQLPGQSHYPPLSWPNGFPLNGIENLRLGKRPPQNSYQDDWGPLNKSDLEMGDGQMVKWAIEKMKEKRDKPLFLTTGIFRPHMPWYAPQSYFDLYDVNTIAEPPLLKDDLNDVPTAGHKFVRSANFDYFRKIGKYREAVEAYLSAISYADALVGHLLAAAQENLDMSNTVVILWSDHGWHLGEKEHWQKNTLWERATRVPLIISAPQVNNSGSLCHRTVSLVDLYPTLIDLCHLTPSDGLDGKSLVPLLRDPELAWKRPAVTTAGQGNHTVRDEHWRLIQYAEGSQELYDHRRDPNEWHNLASDKSHAPTIHRLASWLPKRDAPAALTNEAYEFDHNNYTWTLRGNKSKK